MKEIIKRYYELDDETKDMLYGMSLFHEIENQVKEGDNEYLDKLGSEEKILEIAMICSYLTQLDGIEIIKRLIEILNCRDITIEDISNLTTDELKELILDFDSEEEQEEQLPNLQLIKKFLYNDANCLFFKDIDNDKYVIVYKKDKNDDKVRALTFNCLEDLISLIVDVDMDNECENTDDT